MGNIKYNVKDILFYLLLIEGPPDIYAILNIKIAYISGNQKSSCGS